MKRTKRGMFLITTLFVITFLVILGTTIMITTLSSLGGAGTYFEREIALQAAQAGANYIQARIENNCTTYAPTGLAGAPGPAPPTVDYPSTSGVEVVESGWNVAGLVQNVVDANQPAGLFRISFCPTYQGYTAPNPAPNATMAVGTYTVPAIGYVSLNNLMNGISQTADQSYQMTAGAASSYRDVPGQMCDCIVEGFAVRPDGSILAHRYLEIFFQLAGVGDNNSAAAVMAPGNMNLAITATVADGGHLTAGLASGSSLNGTQTLMGIDGGGSLLFTGLDAPTGPSPGTPTPPPPGFTNGGSTEIGAGQNFTYNYGGGSQSFNSLAGNSGVAPPAVLDTDLPGVRANPSTIKAGTWVNYNNAWYHYDANNYNPALLVGAQTWGAGSPPTLNGVSSDSPPAGEALDPTGHITFPGTGASPAPADINTAVVSTNDVQVMSSPGQVWPTPGVNPGSSTPGTLNGVTLLVAPAADSGGNPINPGNSSAFQLRFSPPDGGVTPQFRSDGGFSMVGTVTGQGSIVTTNAAGSGLGNITIQGQSVLDPGSSSGIALYSSGNVTVMGLDPNQLPGSVAALANPTNPVAGSLEADVASALLTYLEGQANSGDYGDVTSMGAPPTYTTQQQPEDLAQALIGDYYSGGDYGGDFGDYAPPPPTALYTALQGAGITGDSMEAFVANIVTQLGTPSGFGDGDGDFGDFGDLSYSFSQTALANASTPSSPSPAPSGSASPAAAQVLDQVFGGLVYTYGNFNIPMANNILVQGSLVVYGGDPNTGGPGTNPATGQVNATGKSLNFLYDPTMIGVFANFFHNKITLTRTMTNMF